MKKIRVAKKDIRGAYAHEFKAGYCELQTLFKWCEPTFYTCGNYGWNFDAYTDSETDTIITTGYRGTFGERIPAGLVSEYSERARAVLVDWYNRPSYQEELAEIRREFFRELVRQSEEA